MKKILSPNEEQNGLKLIQVNDGLVVVDLNLKLKVKDLVIKTTSDNSIYELDNFGLHLHQRGSSGDGYAKIIFASANLNLEGVPEIEVKDDYQALRRIGLTSDQCCEVSDYYEKAQQNLFTEEQVREAIKMVKKGINDEVKNEDAIIQSIKQPKVEITFEGDKPIKCVML